MPKPFTILFRTILVVVATALNVSMLRAQETERPPNLSEKVSAAVSSLQPLFEQKKWAEVITTIDGQLDKVGANTYDRAYLLQLKVAAFFNTGDNAGVQRALEDALKIGDSLDLWRFPRGTMQIPLKDSLFYLAQFALLDAQTPGKSVADQQVAYRRVYNYMRRLIDLTPNNPAIDHQLLMVQVLYYQAIADPNKVDLTIMKQAQAEVQKALTLSLEPKEDVYMLQLAIHQGLGEHSKMSELIELMLKKYPNNKGNWQQLFGTYAAQEGQDVRAIITLERAQALGLMKTERDNFMLAGLYYNAQQYYRAAEILKNGLRSGEIESIQRNWELWAECYIRLGLENAAIEVYKEAAAKFPEVGSFDLQIGQIYFSRDDQDGAIKFMKSAVEKTLNDSQRAQTYYSIAYLALELRRLDEALPAAKKAVELDPRSKTNKILLDAITNSIKEREEYSKPRV